MAVKSRPTTALLSFAGSSRTCRDQTAADGNLPCPDSPTTPTTDHTCTSTTLSIISCIPRVPSSLPGMAESPSFSSTMLPEPALTFTLPSLHDGLTLDCRVYHPQSLSASPKSPPWRKHGAIVAHPYAPLGGCYDDPVVDIVAGTLLQCGFVVGTFNFRSEPQPTNPSLQYL